MNNPTTLPAPRHRFSPATVIAAGCLIAMIAFGIRSAMGLFNAPITGTHGWSQQTFGFAMALQNLLWGLVQPLAGVWADKFGAARVVIAGALVYAAGLILMAEAGTPAMLHFSGGLLMGTGIAMTSFSLIMAAFARMVPDEKRSWAFGIATAASSFGQFVFAPLGQGFISAYGWQNALFIMAGLTLALIVIAVPLFTRQDRDRRSLEPATPVVTVSQALKQAFGHTSYVLLVFGFFVCGFHVAFITVYLPRYVVELGVSATIAGWSIGLVGLFNIFGAYLAGVWGGRHSKRYALTFIYAARAVVILAFVTIPVSNVSTLVFTAFMGLLWLSTVPLTMGLVAVMFGTRYMATLFGIVFLSHQIGSFTGVWLGGLFYDLHGNYDMIWYAGIVLGITAALVHWPIREEAAPDLASAKAG